MDKKIRRYERYIAKRKARMCVELRDKEMILYYEEKIAKLTN